MLSEAQHAGPQPVHCHGGEAPGQVARQGPQVPPVVEPLLVDVAGVARLLAVSERTVWALHSRGGLPLPVRLPGTRTIRWILDELRDWLENGAPERTRWAAMRGKGRH